MGCEEELELLEFACRANRSGAWKWCIAEDSVRWTSVLYDLFGIPTDTEIDFELAMSLFEPKSRERLISVVDACVKTGVPYDEVLQAKPAEGSPFWARATGFAERNEAGKIIELQGSLHDISAEREALEAQRLSAIDLERVLNSIPDGFFILDQQWRFTFLNAASETLLRRAPSDLRGKSIWAEFPEAIGERCEEVYRRVMETGGTETFTEYFQPLDTWFQVAAHRAPNWLVVHFRDASNRLEKERELKKQEERFRLIADTVSDVLWDFDVETNALWITPSWSQKLDLSYGEAEIAPERWLDFVCEEDRPRCVASLLKTLRSRSSEWQEEARVVRDDGITVYIQMNATLFRKDDGTVYRALGNLRNIDDEKRLNELEARNRGLEALRQMTGGIAHDFNNLLAIIIGYAEALEASDLGHKDKEAAELIGQAADSAAELTKGLLEFSGETQLRVSVLDVNELLERLMPLIRSSITNQIELEYDADECVWPIRVDPTALEQALLNLALNARDAMPTGGKLLIKCENKLISEEMVGHSIDPQEGNYVCISVADNGTGMTQEVLDRAREPYFTTKGVGKGTGLGLSSAYGFAKQSGGELHIYTEIGVGTRATLYLPSASDLPEADKELLASSKYRSGRGISVLIVEDQKPIRDHLRRVLSRQGYSVTTAADGQIALEKVAQEGPYDLLFTDVIMPGGIDGFELSKMARETAPAMQVLISTGFAGPASDTKAESLEGIEILEKPYRWEQLFDALEKALYRR